MRSATGSDPPLRGRCRQLGRAVLLGTTLALVAALGSGSKCTPQTVPLTVTLNAVPQDVNDLLVVPPSGFTVDVGFPEPDEVAPGSLALEIAPFASSSGNAPPIDVTGDLVVDEPDRAVAVVSAELAEGSYWVLAQVDGAQGGRGSTILPFAVREHPSGGPPLEEPQQVQLDFSADPDGDGQSDLLGDLQAVGLLTDLSGLEFLVISTWVEDEIVARTEAFYATPNPSGLPGGDAVDVSFGSTPPGSGPFTRMCVGGADPSGNGVIGNVLFDPGNGDPAEVACDDFLPSGIFPREMLAYSGSGAFQQAFGPVMDTPVGEDPLDPVVLGPDYDPGDPEQLARFQEIETAVEAFAQVVATIAAHETGHAIGLVPRGPPGKGLFGGDSGVLDTHNVTPQGDTPAETLLMNAGPSFSFAELSGQAALPHLRELNFAYLRGRLVLDPLVTGIYPPPVLDYSNPTEISLSGPPVLTHTSKGDNFLETPSIRLLGPLNLGLLAETFVSEQEVTATVQVLQLAPGTYDVELTNADGQVAILENAVEVVP